MTYGVSSLTLRTGEVTQSAECCFSIHETPVSSATPHKLGITVPACDPSIWAVETGGSKVQNHIEKLSWKGSGTFLPAG